MKWVRKNNRIYTCIFLKIWVGSLKKYLHSIKWCNHSLCLMWFKVPVCISLCKAKLAGLTTQPAIPPASPDRTTKCKLCLLFLSEVSLLFETLRATIRSCQRVIRGLVERMSSVWARVIDVAVTRQDLDRIRCGWTFLRSRSHHQLANGNGDKNEIWCEDSERQRRWV